MNEFLLRNAILAEGQSRLCVSTWPYDKFPSAPELNAGSRVTIINVDGPGVISNIHVSNYVVKGHKLDWVENSGETAVAELQLRVWYDFETEPSIDMPFMDFLCDIQYSSNIFNTIYFSKVKYSHNFRLAMPFRKHIKIEIENTSEKDLVGYTEVQWEKLPQLPENCGYLFVDYRKGSKKIPHETIEIFNINRPGAIVAQWIDMEASDPACKKGEVICEANNEIYLDGDGEPTMEYQGTEDYYGYSWGFHGMQSDHYAAILNEDEAGDRIRITLLRCRDTDKIRFQKSCRIVMDYTQEYFSELSQNPRHKTRTKRNIELQYRSCYYYYSNKEETT
ncbi:MAG TPA: hypothetical protein DCY35_04420 [Prolixibacteraceae bacterium]|nr:hypothetical protein [Prolixibacteraceae bacterium]